MSYIKRRQFLQFAGSAASAAGFSQLDIMRQSQEYGKVLAQSTPRKLALLVGINEYINNIPALGGLLKKFNITAKVICICIYIFILYR